MGAKIIQVDAFTSEPFKGNPAAVCILDEPRDEKWMQHLAEEMNLSETAFLVPDAEAFHLRWFTPTTEVDLCGHATLASAHALWESGILKPEQPARFDTKSGRLTARLKGEWIELDFPANTVEKIQAPKGLLEALGGHGKFTGWDGTDYLVEVESESQVRALTPDLKALKRFPARGISVTSRADSKDFDFVSRFFAPAAGIDEDPVTGSAHCSLGPFWAIRLGRQELLGYQASSRGGFVRVSLNGGRVLLGGQAVTVFQGELF
ncbi:MAG: isomerase [Nitrospinaceae bacterium]|nr:MAG: isomerase [Nitrospinaceae bacterium]